MDDVCCDVYLFSAKGIGYPVARQTKDKIEDKPWELLSLRSWRHDVSDNKPDVISKRHDVIPRCVLFIINFIN